MHYYLIFSGAKMIIMIITIFMAKEHLFLYTYLRSVFAQPEMNIPFESSTMQLLRLQTYKIIIWDHANKTK